MSNDYYSLSNLVRESLAQVLLRQTMEEQIRFLEVYAPEQFRILNEKYKIKKEEEKPRKWVTIETPKQADTFTLTPIEAPGAEMKLTPANLQDVVVPVIHAIFNIQHVLDRLNGIMNREIRIRYISQSSPIEVKIEGISNALQVIETYVNPSCKERAKAKTEPQLLNLRDRISLEEEELAVLENSGRRDEQGARKAAEEGRIMGIRDSLDNLRRTLETMRKTDELARIKLAGDIIKNQATEPDEMTEYQKILFIKRLDEPLRILLQSPVLVTKAEAIVTIED